MNIMYREVNYYLSLLRKMVDRINPLINGKKKLVVKITKDGYTGISSDTPVSRVVDAVIIPKCVSEFNELSKRSIRQNSIKFLDSDSPVIISTISLSDSFSTVEEFMSNLITEYVNGFDLERSIANAYILYEIASVGIYFDRDLLHEYLKDFIIKIDGSLSPVRSSIYNYLSNSIDDGYNLETDNMMYDKYLGEYIVIPSNKVLINCMTDLIVSLDT